VLFELVMRGLLEHRLLHADPNFANFAFLEDGRVIVYDFGCVKEIPEAIAEAYSSLLLAALEERPEDMPEVLFDLKRDPAEMQNFIEDVAYADALERFLCDCHPDLKVVRLKLWQARWIARLTGRMDFVSQLIAFFDRVGELGNPAEANALLGVPSTTLDEWIESQGGERAKALG